MGTSHHWNLKNGQGMAGSRLCQVCVPHLPSLCQHLTAPHRMGMKLKILGIPGQ